MNATKSSLHDRVTAEAAEWLAAMQASEVNSRDRAQFAEWLAQSAEHVYEYLQLSTLWRDLGGNRMAPAALEELVEAARRDARSGNVVALENRSSPPTSDGARLSLRWKVAIAAGITLMVASLAWITLPQWYGQHYLTDVGEQISFTLRDGSIVRLNTRSKLRVRMTAKARDLELLRGEALFEVAKDPTRPFRVNAGPTTIQVLGTVFNVYRQADDATVTVIEGKVQVASASATAPQVLEPKEQARVSARGSVVKAQHVNLEQVTAWQDRRLLFTGSTLAEVAAEFNRYNSVQLHVEGTVLERLRINAVFKATDPDSLVEFLQRTEGVAVRPDRKGGHVLYRR